MQTKYKIIFYITAIILIYASGVVSGYYIWGRTAGIYNDEADNAAAGKLRDLRERSIFSLDELRRNAELNLDGIGESISGIASTTEDIATETDSIKSTADGIAGTIQEAKAINDRIRDIVRTGKNIVAE